MLCITKYESMRMCTIVYYILKIDIKKTVSQLERVVTEMRGLEALRMRTRTFTYTNVQCVLENKSGEQVFISWHCRNRGR